MAFVEGLRRLFGNARPENKREIEKKEIPQFLSNAESRKGDNHDENEDGLISDQGHQLYAVFDGVSGAEGGKIASEIARGIFEKGFQSLPFELSENEAIEKMRFLIQEAHTEICKLKEDERDTAPGTTATVIKFLRDPKTQQFYGVIGNVGDSRLYHVSKGNFRRLTRDHNKQYQESMDRQGKKDAFVNNLSFVDATTESFEDELDHWAGADYNTPDGKNVFAQSKSRNVITSSLGVTNVRPNYVDIVIVRGILPGDKFLLTSDGIHDNLTTDEISSIIGETTDTKKLVEAAYKRSNEFGHEDGNLRAKPDDMTAVLLEINIPQKQRGSVEKPVKEAA
ncbi:MAG TPA: serine/threonine-protein phosphatase [Candidatus Magasanikbacteria bacterium]|nr:serine/threonine-protein phosphatase [Candidatus Magasanikbacteria bacterium]